MGKRLTADMTMETVGSTIKTASRRSGRPAPQQPNRMDGFDRMGNGGTSVGAGTFASAFDLDVSAVADGGQALARTIEGEVIPRLLMALRSAAANDPPRVSPALPDHTHVLELTRLTIAADATASLAYVEKLHAKGMALEAIYSQLLAPAARELGELWTEDACDFNDVTIGLGRLQQIVRKLSPAFRHNSSDPRESDHQMRGRDQYRCIISPVRGEKHTLGCVMIEDFFSRAGWDVTGWPLFKDNDLIAAVRNDHYDMVGFSVGCENQLDTVEMQIKDVRKASRNRSLIVMVGGRVFSDDPSKAKAVGADATGITGRDAVTAAEAALTRLVEKS